MTNVSIFYISISYITDNVEKVSIRCKFPFCTRTIQMRFDWSCVYNPHQTRQISESRSSQTPVSTHTPP